MKDRMWDMADLLEGEYDRLGVKSENLGNAKICLPELGYLGEIFNEEGLIAIGGRPGMGKSALAVNMGISAVAGGTRVLFFSLESSAHSLALRSLSAISAVALKQLYARDITEDERLKLAVASSVIPPGSFTVDDIVPNMPSAIRAKVMELRQDYPDDKLLVIVDYVQLMRADEKVTPRSKTEEISCCLYELAKTADEEKVPVVVFSQLNREARSVHDKGLRHPTIAHFREIDDISKYATTIMTMHSPYVYGGKTGTPVDVLSTKALDGALRRMRLEFDSQHQRYRILSDIRESQE